MMRESRVQTHGVSEFDFQQKSGKIFCFDFCKVKKVL